MLVKITMKKLSLMKAQQPLTDLLRQEQANSTSLRKHLLHNKITSVCTTVTLLGVSLFSSLGIWIQPTQAAPLPKRSDWCGTIWSLEANPLAAPYQLARVSPTTGASSSTAPNANITMPSPGLPNTGVNGAAALGIHVQSGTLFAFTRDGTGQLYKYRFGYDTTWQTVTTNLPGVGSTPSANLNKMTVDGDFLYLSDSTGSPLYSLQLVSTTGALLSSTAAKTPYSYTGIPAGTPTLGGGDITTDEYGDTYNVTYDNPTGTANTTLYFFKQNTATNTWVYQGQATSDDKGQFGGAAFYKGDLYVKNSNGKLKKLTLTRSGSGYTGWGNLSAPGTGNGATDLAACGTPNITIGKTQQLYDDAAATILSSDQVHVKTGKYIKYNITAKNTGDAWGRISTLTDPLPAGSTYIPNSAVLNGTNLNVATYPSAGFLLNGPGAAAGIIPFAPDPDTATLTFVVQVSATSGGIQNRATIAYIDNGLPAEPSDCNAVPKFNCGESPNAPVYPSISGTVWNDANSSITIDGTPLETGTNAGGLTVYGVNGSGVVLSKATVKPDGTYTLINFNPGDVVTVRLSTDASVAVGGTAPVSASIPIGWAYTGENKNGTTETIGPGEITSITLGAMGSATLNQNFGLRISPAKVLLVKRITAINGTNLNVYRDDTSSSHAADDSNSGWPTPLNTNAAQGSTLTSTFLRGEINAGNVKPGDIIEYTIYFLNAGGGNATGVRLCDRITGEQKFSGTTIPFQQNNAAPIVLTSAAADDRATFYATSSSAPAGCNFENTPPIDNGAVVVDVTGAAVSPPWTSLLGSFGAAGTTNSYGFFRFNTQINP
jgi:uncharacterized repeat protein (TIGR01451 family)